MQLFNWFPILVNQMNKGLFAPQLVDQSTNWLTNCLFGQANEHFGQQIDRPNDEQIIC